MSKRTKLKRQLTLLAVAPNKEILSLVKAVLSAENHKVLLTHTEEDAYSLAQAEQPDVILSTSGIHEMGPRLCQRIRQDKQLAGTPFILLTTSSNRRTYSTYFAQGCDQILPIPFKCADIYRVIDRVHHNNRKNTGSLIHVLLKSGLADFVDTTTLDRMLSEREVLCFRRKSGLAIIGRDPIRLGSQSTYNGPERRQAYA